MFLVYFCFFFFSSRRRHTRSLRDWSSDVCSSDLGQLTHGQSTTLAELIARAVESRHPEIATTVRHIPSRKGRVYLDYLQNGHGKTIAGPFSARPVAGATVSMPLRWNEVNGKLDPRKFTLATAPARLKKLREDPLAPVLELNPDLQGALARLAGKLK